MTSGTSSYNTDGMREGTVHLDDAGARAQELAAKLAGILEPWTGAGAGPDTAAFGAQLQEPGQQMVEGLNGLGQLFTQYYSQGVTAAANRVDSTIDANVQSVPDMT